MSYMTLSEEIEIFEDEMDMAESTARGILRRMNEEGFLGKNGAIHATEDL